MVAWAPNFVTSIDLDRLARKRASGIDVYKEAELAALVISATMTRILKSADTSDVQFWEFIHVILVFMCAMMTRPDMKKRFGWAFPARLMAPFLNMALCEAESWNFDWDKMFQSENFMRYPQLYENDMLDMYGPTTIFYWHQLDNATKEKMEESIFDNPLPEDKALQGLFFTRECNGRWDSHLVATSNNKFDFNEEKIRNGSIQDENTQRYRIIRILRTISQLIEQPDGTPGFFSLMTGEDETLHIVVPGDLSLPPSRPDTTMPEVCERSPGVRVIFVDRSLIDHAAETDMLLKLRLNSVKTKHPVAEETRSESSEPEISPLPTTEAERGEEDDGGENDS